MTTEEAIAIVDGWGNRTIHDIWIAHAEAIEVARTLADDNKQLRQALGEARNHIAEWEGRCREAEADCASVEKIGMTVLAERDAAQKALAEAQEKLLQERDAALRKLDAAIKVFRYIGGAGILDPVEASWLARSIVGEPG